MSVVHGDRDALTLVIDTDSYSGNFERQLFSFIFGVGDLPGNELSNNGHAYFRQAAVFAVETGKMPLDFVRGLLEARVRDCGDDSVYRSYVDISSTPGYFNDGHGQHYEDNEKNRRKVGAKHRYPAFQSVAVFLLREPEEDELKFIKKRAQAFCDMPKRNEWDSRPKILGFRLITESVRRHERTL